MELTDLQYTKADKKNEAERWSEPDNAEDYPWGLRIRLDDVEVRKLKLGDLDAEQPVRLMAEGFVAEDSAHKRNGKTVRAISIQITKLAVVQSESNEDTAEELYGEK